MLSPIIVVTSSAVCLLSIPFILNACHLGYVIPRLAQYLNVDRYVYGIEPVVLCLGIVTFYTYVLLGFVFDVIHALRPHYITSERSLLFTKLERAHQELRKLFPPFVVSSLLMYSNTSRFDTLRNSFLVFQTLLLLIQPIAYLWPTAHLGSSFKFLFRATLFWSILFAMFPRETQHYISEIMECTRDVFSSKKYRQSHHQHHQYPSRRQLSGSNGMDYWIL